MTAPHAPDTSLPEKIVYLDQNKWIELAKVFHHKRAAPGAVAALGYLQDSVPARAAVFPLSAMHYMETWKITDGERRKRLAAFMWELSQGRTIASYRALLVHELETALSKRFPSVLPAPFSLLSAGVSHAFGMPLLEFRLPEPIRSALAPGLVVQMEQDLRLRMERMAIAGEELGGAVAPAFRTTSHNQSFMNHLADLHPRFSPLPPAKREGTLIAMSIADILEPLNSVLIAHKVDPASLGTLGKEGLTALLLDLPSRALDLQLHRQVLQNPHLKPKLTDLEDWGALPPAAAWCDIIVCEKHMADLLKRAGGECRAVVLTELGDLPDALKCY